MTSDGGPPEFQDFLPSHRLVPEKNIPFYRHWGSKFLAFSNINRELDQEVLFFLLLFSYLWYYKKIKHTEYRSIWDEREEEEKKERNKGKIFMRVAMYYNNQDVRLEEMPTPVIGPGELLVKVLASGICGSDVMEWYRIKKAPRVLGHEITGEIVEVGSEIDRYKKGDRVFVSHHIPCNTCHYCLNGFHTVCDTLRSTNFDPGGFSEYIRVPQLNVDRGVFILPEEISFEDGVFIEPLACVLRGQRLARFKPGQNVFVIGSGISGLLHIALACATGAGQIIASDIHEYRLKAAKLFGADEAIHANEITSAQLRQINHNRLFDLVIVCAGSLSAYKQALETVDRGGIVLCFAPIESGVHFSFPFFEFWNEGITLMSTYGCSPFDITAAIELIRAQRLPLRQMITHRLPLAETSRGFRLVTDAKESIKVIIEPHR